MSAKHKFQEDTKVLEEEIDKLRNIIQHIPGCIYWKNKDGVYLGCNQIFLNMAGASSVEEIIGKTDKDLCWKKQANMLRTHDIAVMESGQEKTLEEEVLLKNGSILTYSVIKAPLKDKKGNIIGVIGISLDITHRIEHEKQLALAKEESDAANYIMTEFIANIGHDLATPISDVGSVSQMLLCYIDEYPEFKEYFDTLVTRCEDCEKVRKRLIDATSIANLDIKLEKFSMSLVLLALEKELRSAIEAKGLKLIIYPFKPKKEDFIETDRIKFYAILLDLIMNAINFTDAGQITLSIEKNDGCFDIKVTDTGIGIPSDKFDYIFKQYTKLSRSNKHGANFRGVGAGLYLARIRASILNATISVESQVNKGSTFTLSIPVHPLKNQ